MDAKAQLDDALRRPTGPSLTLAEAEAEAAPAEWEARIGNLTARFPDKTREEIISAMHEAGGRGGVAAGILVEVEKAEVAPQWKTR